jgi:hypothetical protein
MCGSGKGGAENGQILLLSGHSAYCEDEGTVYVGSVSGDTVNEEEGRGRGTVM